MLLVLINFIKKSVYSEVRGFNVSFIGARSGLQFYRRQKSQHGIR